MARMSDRRLDDGLSGSSHPRLLVVVAHPDDEILGCGSLLTRFADARVIHVTDGAPATGEDARRHGFATAAAYAAHRAWEARAALAIAGVAADTITGLGVADQAASRHLADIARRLQPWLAEADLVLTHAFEGGHPDHDAVAYAVQAAAKRLGAAQPRPCLAEMPFYHAGPDGWRRQCFLPHPDAGPERCLPLDADAQTRKAAMLAAHASQGETLRDFATDCERFRLAPAYDFGARPHGGDLLYERHGWNLDWAGWVEHVRAAEGALAPGRAA